MPRCVRDESGGLYTTLGRAQKNDIDASDGVDLPFAPEVGGATPFGGGFAIGVLEKAKDGLAARLVVLSSSLGAVKTVDLGNVHGDVLPPVPVVASPGLVVALPDGAPNGTLVRLARVDDAEGTGAVKFGAEISQAKDDSDAFGIEVGTKRGVVVWDEWSKEAGHSVIKAVTFPRDDIAKTSSDFVISGAREDAESPLVVKRPGGFWVAWIANQKREPDKKERDLATDTTDAVDLGPRTLSLLPLDDDGRPAGAPLSVSRQGGHVLGFDLSPARDGAALVAWRDDKTAPGATGGAAHVAMVSPGGSIDARAVTEDEASVDVPVLVADDAPPAGAPAAWLGVANDSDVARLSALDAAGHSLDELSPEAAFGTGTPLAAHARRVVIAKPSGHRVELEVFTCNQVSAPPGLPAP